MNIKIEIDQRDVKRWAETAFGRQIPFAVSRGINDTALDFQKTQRAHQHEVFTVRRTAFVDRSVKISSFATRTRPAAEIRIDPPGGAERASILTQHQDGGAKRPRRGKSLAIPDAARRSKTGIVARANRPRAFDFKAHGSSGRVMRGDRRTVLIRNADGSGAIYQRVGPRNKRGRGDKRDHRYRSKFRARKSSTLVRLFTLTPEGHLEPRLDFYENARRTVRDRFERNFIRGFAQAISSARPR